MAITTAQRRSLPGVFALTWLAYATTYLGRKGFSVAKVRIAAQLGLSDGALATIDTGYLVAYAVGQFASGALGDRIGARRLVGGGLVLAGVACALFGLARGAPLLIVAFLLNGLAQSAGWPGNTKAMGAVTTAGERGLVMGLWSTCYQVGGIAATSLAARLLRLGWPVVFHVPALLMAMVGVLLLFRLRVPGAEQEPGATTSAEAGGAAAVDEDVAEQRRRAQRGVLRNPRIWCYGAAYFCLKLIRYSLLFWLPFYLHKVRHFDEEQSGYLSTSFEIGGIAGSIFLGVLSDRLRRVPRAVFALVALSGLAAALFLYGQVSPTSWAGNFVLLALVGALLFGPDTLISGAVSQDAGGRHAAATAAGIINGVGSAGAVLQGWVTVGVSARWGWDALFQLFVGLAIAGTLCLLPTLAMRDRDPEG